VDQDEIETLSRAWLRGDEDAVVGGEPVIVGGPAPDHVLAEALRETWLGGTPTDDGVTERERRILHGDTAGALRGPEGPRSTRDWIAVAAALTIGGRGTEAVAYRRPEVLRAVFERVEARRRAPDVVALARWLDGAQRPAS
jgi:hypothetical protein